MDTNNLLSPERTRFSIHSFNVKCLFLREIHDHLAEFQKQTSLEWLGEIVSYHFSAGTILHVQVTRVDSVGDKEVSDVEVSGAIAA